ncbi:MAG TPA: glycerate kinase [Polyangiaceae bacterium]|jgi:glycerate kinase|nr:glycerate kinase [Polyangiaceae bacterium]
MRILIAPDSFKGSLTAEQAADAMRRGVVRAFPVADVECLPLSDGGDGMARVLVAARGGATHAVDVTGPLGAPVRAEWVMRNDGTALIESATAIGFALVPAASRAPTETTTAGVGELIRDALAAGATRIVVGLGGSATTDGGAGMARSLGVEFDGAPSPFTGGRLMSLRGVDVARRDPRLASVKLVGVTDVDNPLTGAEGAARTYGPQKGATDDELALLDAALVHLAGLAGDEGRHPGDGAAGGLGYGLRVFLGAELSSGIDFVLDQTGFDEKLAGVTLVLTGEGRLDGQTARGKVVAGISARCHARGVPVIALAGAVSGDVASLLERGLTAYFSLCDRPMSERDAMRDAGPLLESLAFNVVRAFGLETQ